MLNAILAGLGILAILVVSEVAWRKSHIKDEVARKFVHILTGMFIASFGFWVEQPWIIVMAIGFIVVNVVNRYTGSYDIFHFHAIHTVKRKSWGDVLFGVGVLIVALINPTAWIFAASILMVSLADGLAAIGGVTYGLKHGAYYVFGQPKSVIGSGIFWATALVILLLLFFLDPYFAEPMVQLPMAIVLSLMLVCLENLSVYGTDNVILPVATVLALSLL